MSTNAHHTQFPATPWRRTMSVTRFGVSLEKVVATIDSPASHQGTERPDAKNSVVSLLERLPKKSAGTKQMASETATMNQSSAWSCMVRNVYIFGAPGTRARAKAQGAAGGLRAPRNSASTVFASTLGGSSPWASRKSW